MLAATPTILNTDTNTKIIITALSMPFFLFFNSFLAKNVRIRLPPKVNEKRNNVSSQSSYPMTKD